MDPLRVRVLLVGDLFRVKALVTILSTAALEAVFLNDCRRLRTEAGLLAALDDDLENESDELVRTDGVGLITKEAMLCSTAGVA